MKYKGYVYLIGAGPGDAELITVKGKKLLETCDVVIYDRLASSELLSCVSDDCKKIYVGKKPGAHAMKQEEINQVLVTEALKGQQIVRLKGGDPFVFGRGGEEILALEAAGIGYEVIPGITSAIAVPMAAGIPVTHRGLSRSFHVITGHTADTGNTLTEQFQAYAQCEGTLVFLMGLANLPLILEKLQAAEMPASTPIAIVEQGTTIRQRTVRGTFETIIEQVQGAGLQSPVVIVIGKVAELSFKQPVRKIGLTGTANFVEKLSMSAKGEGRELYKFPYVKIQERQNHFVYAEQLGNYQWIVFTSANGIRCFFEQLTRQRVDFRKLAMLKFAVIGKGTAQVLEQYGIYADFIPTEAYAEVLGRELAMHVQKDDKLLLVRAAIGSRKLTEALEKAEIAYTELSVYDTVADELILSQTIESLCYLDELTFASASGVRFLCDALDKGGCRTLLSRLRLFCIGRETANALQAYGIENYEIAPEASIDGLVSLL